MVLPEKKNPLYAVPCQFQEHMYLVGISADNAQKRIWRQPFVLFIHKDEIIWEHFHFVWRV